MKKTAPALCPCGSGQHLPQCCGRFDPEHPAPDAPTLMRSRYTAYARGDAPYLLATWHATTRPATLDLTPPQAQWIGLKLLDVAVLDTDHAEVEFVARYRVGGRAERLHERSRFIREDGRWFYVDGTFPG